MTVSPSSAPKTFIFILVQPGTGSARRFTCPYHAWTYDQRGDLVGIVAKRLEISTELRVALEELHRRIPDYRIPEGTSLLYSPGIRQTLALPLEFTPEA